MVNTNFLGYSFYNVVLYFTLYSFLGWLLETIYASINEHHFVNRGFLAGPFCPMYGFGAVAVIIFAKTVNHDGYIKLFLLCSIIASVMEYVTGYILEKIFKSKWWDYSNDPFNLNGRICLLYSILWGILGIVVIKILHPIGIEWVIRIIPGSISAALMYCIIIYFAVDFTTTVIKLVELKKLFLQLEDITYQVKSVLINLKISASEKTIIFAKIPEEIRNKYGKLESIPKDVFEKYRGVISLPSDINKKISDIQSFFKDKANNVDFINDIPKELKEKYEHTIESIARRYERLFTAFPQFNSNALKKSFVEIRSKIKSKYDNLK